MQHRADRVRILRRGRVRGIALVTVISVMLILVVITTGFTAFTTQDMKTSQTTYEQAQTYCLAEAGLDYGMFLIKHSMLIYPCPPVQVTWRGEPMASDAAFSTDRTYDATNNDNDLNDTTNRTAVGAVVNVSKSGQEFVLVSDLSYPAAIGASGTTPNNWMEIVRYCGTFNLRYTLTTSGGTTTIRLTSTGYIKVVPSSVDMTSKTGFTDSTGGANIALLQNWTVVAQRTLNCDVISTTTPTAGKGTIKVVKFYEQFR